MNLTTIANYWFGQARPAGPVVTAFNQVHPLKDQHYQQQLCSQNALLAGIILFVGAQSCFRLENSLIPSTAIIPKIIIK